MYKIGSLFCGSKIKSMTYAPENVIYLKLGA